MLNDLTIEWQHDDSATLTMTITPVIEKTMRDTFNLEIEMLQGIRKDLPEGMIHYELTVHDPQKIVMLKEFMLKFISQSHLSNDN